MDNIIRKKMSFNRLEYFKKYIEIVSIILNVPLVEMEINVLASFLSLDKGITEDYMFNTVARKKVMESLKLSPGGLSNYIRSLISKGYLLKSEINDSIKIRSGLFLKNDLQDFQIRLVNNDYIS